jgi:hypothetical protein
VRKRNALVPWLRREALRAASEHVRDGLELALRLRHHRRALAEPQPLRLQRLQLTRHGEALLEGGVRSG